MKTSSAITAIAICLISLFVASTASTARPGPPRKAVYPVVEIVNYVSHIGTASGGRRKFFGAVIKLRISNKGRSKTDPFLLTIKDNNSLFRSAAQVRIPSLNPGATQLRDLTMDADGLSPSSGGPEATHFGERYREHCGPSLVAAMDWTGSQAQIPMDAHLESGLEFESASSVPQAQADPYVSICDATHCVKPCAMAKEIHKQLDGHVVGYSYFVGLNSEYGSYGQSRTAADGGSRNFTPQTKIMVASVSKLVTTLAAVRMLDRQGISLDATIGPYLPSDWSVSRAMTGIKFNELLSQTSGIKDYGNIPMDYATVKSFFEQHVTRTNTQSTCDGPKAHNPEHGYNPTDKSRCYSNYNFAIFRILLPRVFGYPEDHRLSRRPQTLADQYESLVRTNVFDRVGQINVTCKPPVPSPSNIEYALAYLYPGSAAGVDPGDQRLTCGSSGWYLSAEDMAKVLLSINARDEKILAESDGKHQFQDMRVGRLGWDVRNNRELEKNGGYGSGPTCTEDTPELCNIISTSAAVFGPVTGPRLVALLFLNSNISGGVNSGKGAQDVLESAYKNSIFPK